MGSDNESKGKDKKDKDKDKDKSKDSKDKSKDGHKVAEGHAGQFAPPPGYGQWSSPPFVPPTFEANRAAAPGFPTAGAPSFPSAGTPGFPSASPGFPTPPQVQHHDSTQAAAPPSGYRVPLSTTSPFPDAVVAGQPPCYDADGVTPIFIGSALFENSVHPCKIGPHLQPFASVAYGGAEHAHHGRFDLLPFVPQTMEWVRTSYGRVPPGRSPIEGGYEDNGAKLYHGLALVNGVRVPGKAGEHLGACNVAFGGAEIALTDHEILCWR
ncbi:hypothetical protein FPV67DRAFT_911055 [Lyophyllum atratum]|nr:hypothetical protein FPV67DRAFT_911055 [Lyophyllum atratum]